ncbi:hypothetical protein ZIOFF_052904 [Zingiber officinale]|uniref:Uncharacterized protein n=1 Tax=Zingiber officinale TaxID=94328 RepID=A0A8J5FBQ0_ZINOF|nr:hypothetical protein ZIOFF_052904 [Zingiber officinale]
MALYLPSPPLKLPLALLVPRLSSRTPPSSSLARRCPSVSHLPRRFPGHRRRGGLPVLASVGKEETDVRVSEEDQSDVSPEDLECHFLFEKIAQTYDSDAFSVDIVNESQFFGQVLELLKKNRDMIFGEVKLTIMIEDPRDVERKRLLGIDDAEDITRDDLVTALEDVCASAQLDLSTNYQYASLLNLLWLNSQELMCLPLWFAWLLGETEYWDNTSAYKQVVNEGRIPKNRVALKLLAKEMTEWPNLEVESLEKGRPRKSLYAKATDTGVDPQAAKRLNIDWDSAVDIDPEDEDGDGDDIDVPPAVGYGALYLVTALPIIIAVSVVLILFYNSLQ